MLDFISEIIAEAPEHLMTGVSATPAANYLFDVNPNARPLSSDDATLFHRLVAKLLYLSKRTRPDLQLAVSFLTTRVQAPDVDDFKKLGRCLRYLCDTKDLPLTLEASSAASITWWVDASFAVHPDYKSHTGATMTLGKGSIYSTSTKQKLNTRSSTEAELVGINDAMSIVLWTRHFLEAQGVTVDGNVLLQDNQSTMLLAKKGRQSSGKRTRHLNIRYYFVTDNVKRNRMTIEYCPTEDMLADFFTKPLQGALFRKLRARILNLPDEAGGHMPAVQECVGTSDVVQARRPVQKDTVSHKSYVEAARSAIDGISDSTQKH